MNGTGNANGLSKPANVSSGIVICFMLIALFGCKTPEQKITSQDLRNCILKFEDALKDGELHYKAISSLLFGACWEHAEVREYIFNFILNKKEDPVCRRRVLEMLALRDDPGSSLVAYKILFDENEDKDLRKLAYQFHIMKNYWPPEERKLAGVGWPDAVRRANEKDPPTILSGLRESLRPEKEKK